MAERYDDVWTSSVRLRRMGGVHMVYLDEKPLAMIDRQPLSLAMGEVDRLLFAAYSKKWSRNADSTMS